jgi:hypothetical protein
MCEQFGCVPRASGLSVIIDVRHEDEPKLQALDEHVQLRRVRRHGRGGERHRGQALCLAHLEKAPERRGCGAESGQGGG